MTAQAQPSLKNFYDKVSVPNSENDQGGSNILFGWGVNEDGQLSFDTADNVNTPQVINRFIGVQFAKAKFGTCSIVAGSRSSAALDAQGQLWTWGWNDRGSLGHGHRKVSPEPRTVSFPGNRKVVQVDVGGWHCAAVMDNGHVMAWGGNEYQQCTFNETCSDKDFQGNSRVHKSDVVLPKLAFSQKPIRMVACGGMHTIALDTSGCIWQWGERWGDFTGHVDPSPRLITTEQHVQMTHISTEAFHNLAVGCDGQVYSWGTNDFGQLGNGTSKYQTSPQLVVGLEDQFVTTAIAGGWHSMAITESGRVYTWGRGEYGRLGLGDPTGASRLRPCLVPLLDKFHVVQGGCGGSFSMVLCKCGSMFVWGRGSYGRLGTGTSKNMLAPVEVKLPGGKSRWSIQAISTGGRHVLCLSTPKRDLHKQGFTAPSVEQHFNASNTSASGGMTNELSASENSSEHDNHQTMRHSIEQSVDLNINTVHTSVDNSAYYMSDGDGDPNERPLQQVGDITTMVSNPQVRRAPQVFRTGSRDTDGQSSSAPMPVPGSSAEGYGQGGVYGIIQPGQTPSASGSPVVTGVLSGAISSGSASSAQDASIFGWGREEYIQQSTAGSGLGVKNQGGRNEGEQNTGQEQHDQRTSLLTQALPVAGINSANEAKSSTSQSDDQSQIQSQEQEPEQEDDAVLSALD